jgi:hypothetical protein
MAYGHVDAGREARRAQDPFAEFGRTRSGRTERHSVSGQVGHGPHGRVGPHGELEVGLADPPDRPQRHRVREEAGALRGPGTVGEDEGEDEDEVVGNFEEKLA